MEFSWRGPKIYTSANADTPDLNASTPDGTEPPGTASIKLNSNEETKIIFIGVQVILKLCY
jgi:hypothetical protein